MNTREAITAFIFRRDPPRHVDLAMVLGCPSLSNMEPAVELYQRGMTPRLLISGHGPEASAAPEWLSYRDYALERGVPEAALLLEKSARNTRENFVLSAEIISKHIGWAEVTSLALVTKPLHARRALMTARACFPSHVDYTMLSPEDAGSVQAETWWTSEAGRARVMDEVRKIGVYALAGHLADF